MENFVPNNLTKAIEVVDLTKHYGDVKAVDGTLFYIKGSGIYAFRTKWGGKDHHGRDSRRLKRSGQWRDLLLR